MGSEAHLQRGIGAIHDVSSEIVRSLEIAGVRDAYGLLGGAALPFFEALLHSSIDILHFRHESGAVFAAMESWFAGGRPVVVFTTTGPGLMNALTGVAAARRDGAKVVVVSASTAAARRGRWAFQETSQWTMGGTGLFSAGALFDLAIDIESAQELPPVLTRLHAGLSGPGGFVAHLSLSPDVQASESDREPTEFRPTRGISFPVASDRIVDEMVEQLRGRDVLVWVGFGARDAWRETRAFARACGARVVCTPRAKGIVPESDPAFVGVTGLGGHTAVLDELARRPPDVTVVLGTRLGEMSSFWRSELVPRDRFVHVDVEPDAIGTAFPDAACMGIVSEIGDLLRRVTPRLPNDRRPVRFVRPVPPPTAPDPARAAGRIRPVVLMEALQRIVVRGSDAIVLTEAGNAFVWGSQGLAFDEPGRYRVSMGFGSMGHATTGVLGAARTSGGPAVALVGDGALLMNNEINTAAKYGIPAIWVVLNDGAFGLVDHGMQAMGFSAADMQIPRCDFAAIARAMGARGERCEREDDLDAALQRALGAGGPYVVDVWVDASERSPFGDRVASLRSQLDDGEQSG